jgi:hypothetical protein
MADIRKGNFLYVICYRDVKEELAVTVYESGCAKPSVEVYTTGTEPDFDPAVKGVNRKESPT